MLLRNFMCRVIRSLEEEGRFGTARVHGSTMRAFESFVGHKHFHIEHLNPRVLSAFEFYLVSGNRQWNTVSTYMRVLRAVYNRAVDAGIVPYSHRLFVGVYTGTRSDRRRALAPGELARLFHAEVPSRELGRTRDYCRLMFAMRGIPFADLVYLRKCDLQDNTLCYRRHKTGTPMVVELNPSALTLVNRLRSKDDGSPWLFPFLDRGNDARSYYRLYRNAITTFNCRLARLAKRLDLDHLSTYTIRHSWATTAYHNDVHPGIISQALGHSSIAVTEHYLKPFMQVRVNAANRMVLDVVEAWNTKKKTGEKHNAGKNNGTAITS